MNDKMLFYMDEVEVESILKELGHVFISRDNMACFIVLQRMEQFIKEAKNARANQDN